MAAKRPPKLSAGQVLIAAVVAQMAEDGLEPDARDTSLLATSGRLADRMAALDVLIEADGERSTSETGIVRLHPGIAEYRQHAIALSKVLTAVALVETNGAKKDPDKVRAAETRWRAHNAKKEVS